MACLGRRRQRVLERALISAFVLSSCLRADEVAYRYEGDVLPHSAEAGWLVFNACERGCSESVVDGRFRVEWVFPADSFNYHHFITRMGTPPLPSLWVEFRFRSNRPITSQCFGNDADLVVLYRWDYEVFLLHGDAVTSFSGNDYLYGLELDKFHTYRFESWDGLHYTLSGDGTVLLETPDVDGLGSNYIQFAGHGSCGFPNINEWDFIRYGTLDSGEPISSTDPPDGFLDPEFGAGLDRFQVTFDAPNYVYIRDITVETTGGTAAKVIATRRREPPDPFDVEDDPHIVEVVLDRPLPANQTTRFIIDGSEVTNVVRYTLRWADANGDGAVDLFDAALLQDCYGQPKALGDCRAFDLNRSQAIDFGDAADFSALLTGP